MPLKLRSGNSTLVSTSPAGRYGSVTIWLFRLTLLIVTLNCGSLYAQQVSERGTLFSPSVAERFFEIAYELSGTEKTTPAEKNQAMLFLSAAAELDSRGEQIYLHMLRLASQPELAPPGRAGQAAEQTRIPGTTQEDYRQLILELLKNHVDHSADLELTTTAIRYLLESVDSREEREELLTELLKSLSGRNLWLDSELKTMLGLMAAEKADTELAKSYFLAAHDNNKYNRLAFAKIAELMPDQVTPAAYLEHLRLNLAENPMDIEAALAFAEYSLKLGLYEVAAGTYEYCADLFTYTNPSQKLPDAIYLPWAFSAYSTTRDHYKAKQIAARLRQTGHFDLALEAVAAAAAAKATDMELAAEIRRRAEEKAVQLALTGRRAADYERLAWYYCLAQPEPDKALDWANKAYSTEPDSPIAAGLLAYALAINKQTDWAKLLIDNYSETPLAQLAAARMELQKGKRDEAIGKLKALVTAQAGSFIAFRARQILTENDIDYVPPVDADLLLTTLKSSFNYPIVPEFIGPADAVGVELNLRGTEFSYGSDFAGSVTIRNNRAGPLVITDNSLFKGNIRVDARISGDLREDIPNLASLRIRPSSVIEPQASLLVPLRLFTGRLRDALVRSPQAGVDVEFSVTLDGAAGGGGERPAELASAKLTVRRPAVKLSTRFLQNRFDTLSTGRQSQKIHTGRLFTGLLAELRRTAGQEPRYKLMYADWMPELLNSAVVHNLSGDDWIVRTHTMLDIVSLRLDFELINGVSQNLNDTAHWPARMMALYLLAKNQNAGFNKVLSWTAEHDNNRLVRDMAVALTAAKSNKRQISKSDNHLTRHDNSSL